MIPGLPITKEFSGTSKFINVFGAIKEFLPITTFPTIVELAPM
mgnify:CR=1 FL=1